MIILDITNVCNLRCVHCPHAEMQARSDFKPMHFRWEHFTKIVDELQDHHQPCLIRFVGDGEPLLHPRLLDMVDYAKERSRGIVNLTTNGTVLAPDKIDRLLDAGIDIIDVSIDALTKPVYSRVRRGGSFERVMLNIFHLLAAREKRSSHLKVMVSFVEQNENAHEADGFRNYWEPLVDYVMVRRLHSHSAARQAKQQESRERNEAGEQERYPCPHLWKRLTIDFMGRIKFCAHDWETGSVLAQIEESTLKSVWQGDALRAIRSRHLASRQDAVSICRECSDWASSRWDQGYERLVDRVVMGKPTFIPCLPPLSADPVP